MCLQFERVAPQVLAGHDEAASGRTLAPPHARENSMCWSKWIRHSHRWLSMAFTATVVANFVAMIKGPPPALITYAPLLPLFLLLFSGLYLFFLPYVAHGRARHRATLARRQAAAVVEGAQ